MRTLLLGVSTRSIAQSAAGSGRCVVAVDFFGDRDQARLAESYALGRDLGLPLTAEGLGEAARRLDPEAVAYAANLENHADVVQELAERSVVLGNPADVLREVRDWRLLRRFCQEAGILHPTTLFAGEEEQADPGCDWLVKRVRSGGGHGVRLWAGDPLDESHVLQYKVDGYSASVAFVADGRQSRVIGFTEQLVGRRFLGASGYAWCGNVLPYAPVAADGALYEKVARLVSRLTGRFGLRGVNGVDLIVGEGPDGEAEPYLVEVNPRFSGSMELAEEAHDVNVFSLHLEGCAGRLPDLSVPPPAGFFGKGVLYARSHLIVPDTQEWIGWGIRDVPDTGQHIAAGHPICTVLARGQSREACLDDLALRAARMYQEIEGRREDRLERAIHPGHRTYA